MSQAKIFRLDCQPNNYPWGKVGESSLAARSALSGASSQLKEIKPSEPYAELWMGTHPNNPARLWKDETLLSDHLEQGGGVELLGDAQKFPAKYPGYQGGSSGGHLPFLFKILTCKQALPLQVHPNIELAKKLHKENPDQFPDTNHKPEIAVCLSERFLGFAQFRPLNEIRALLRATPEVRQLPDHVTDLLNPLLDPPLLSDDKEGNVKYLADFFAEVIRMEGDEVQRVVKAYTERVQREGVDAFKGAVAELRQRDMENLVEAVENCAEFYPGDGAVFATTMLMNLVELKKGEGMYVGADGVHAWLKGEIVELMAASDNVLNVGFTPEKDDTVLVAKTMTCNPMPAAEIMLKRQQFHKSAKGNTVVYSVPFEEFSMLHVKGDDVLAPLSGPGVAIITEGEGVSLGEKGQSQKCDTGSVWFVAAGVELEVKGGGEVWMAFYDGDTASNDEVGKQ